MTGTVLLVDFENVQELDLTKLPASVRVLVFVGAMQTKIPIQLVEKAQPLGSRLQWLRISRQGRNALDFHIAACLGELFAKEPRCEVLILSGDKGFDPLVESFSARKFACRRVEEIVEIVRPAKAALGDNAKRMLELLAKVEKNKRPRRRKTLEPYVETHFAKLSAAEVAAVIEQLFAQKLISEAGQALTYHF